MNAIMNINMFGCDKYTSGLYYIKEDYVWPNGTLIQSLGPHYKEWDDVPNYFRCSNPQGNPILSAIFWVIFVMVRELVLPLSGHCLVSVWPLPCLCLAFR